MPYTIQQTQGIILQVVLDDLSLILQSGKVTALCGLSGAGKSTLAALLERFYEPIGGRIYLDDTPLDVLDPSWLRKKVIGYIDQEPVLFATSILENIRYGSPGASDEEVSVIINIYTYIHIHIKCHIVWVVLPHTLSV